MIPEIQAYFNKVTDERRTLIDELHALIQSLYPNLQPIISYQILMYKAKTGWVGLGYRKDGVSIYTNGPHHFEELKAKYPKMRTGHGCINLKIPNTIPLNELKQVIIHAVEHSK